MSACLTVCSIGRRDTNVDISKQMRNDLFWLCRFCRRAHLSNLLTCRHSVWHTKNCNSSAAMSVLHLHVISAAGAVVCRSVSFTFDVLCEFCWFSKWIDVTDYDDNWRQMTQWHQMRMAAFEPLMFHTLISLLELKVNCTRDMWRAKSITSTHTLLRCERVQMTQRQRKTLIR